MAKLELLSRTQYDANGVQTVWDFNFAGGYILPEHVKAYYEIGSVRTPVAVGLIGANQAYIVPAVPAGAVLTIYRDTPKNAPLVDFVDRGTVSEVALDTVAKQAVFAAAESSDSAATGATDVAVAAAASAQMSALDAAGSAASAEASKETAESILDSIVATVGSAVLSLYATLAAAGGALLVGFKQLFPGAVLRTVGDKLAESVSVKDFGAIGDGAADDTAAIQLALDYVGANGGGTVFLPRTSASGRYRITSTLRIPSYVTLEGTNPLVFPFSYNNGILADFSNPNQWVIESKTTSGGNNIAYNSVLSAFPDGATYNCGVRNLRIGAVNTTPFGGVRMHGAFAPIIENVAVAEVGCGFLLNESLGGRWSVHSRALYYGMALWNDCNANEISLYAAQAPVVTNVPVSYQLPFMSALNGQLVPVHKLSSNDPYARSTGLIIGADVALSTQTNTLTATLELFSTGVFLKNAKSVVFSNLYLEGSTDNVKFGVIASNSTFNVLGCHAFMSGTGTFLDVGDDTRGIINLDGVPFFQNFGSVYVNSNLEVKNYANPTPNAPKLNVAFTSFDTEWIAPTLANGWVNVGGTNATAGYRKNQKNGTIELKGFITGGTLGASAFTLPVGMRPLEKRNLWSGGGYLAIQPDGSVQPGATPMGLDGIVFKAEQ